MSWRINVRVVNLVSVVILIVSCIGKPFFERVSSEIKEPSSERARIWYGIVSATTEGGVHNDVERSLREVLNFSPDDIDAIRSSTSVTRIYYCQSAFASIGSLRSTGSWRSGSECESARPARLPVIPHHHFAVVHLRATNSEGELLKLFISAEKEGKGQGGGTAGIYINLLTECELQKLEDNTILAWDGFSIEVPLDVLITKLFEGHDTHYNLVNKNCWNYAKAACRSVFLLLSQQPGVNLKQKQILLENAEEVSLSVTKLATLEAVTGIPAIFVMTLIRSRRFVTTTTISVAPIGIAVIATVYFILLLGRGDNPIQAFLEAVAYFAYLSLIASTVYLEKTFWIWIGDKALDWLWSTTSHKKISYYNSSI